MTWRRAALLIVLLAVALPSLLRLDYYRWAGGFREVTPHFAGTCRAAEGVPGPEDLLIDHQTGTAYVSSDDRGDSLEWDRNLIWVGTHHGTYCLSTPALGKPVLEPRRIEKWTVAHGNQGWDDQTPAAVYLGRPQSALG